MELNQVKNHIDVIETTLLEIRMDLNKLKNIVLEHEKRLEIDKKMPKIKQKRKKLPLESDEYQEAEF